MTQRSRRIGAVMGLLLLGAVLTACGAAPVAQNWPGLTLEDDTIYLISGLPQQVYMLDAETGNQQGTFIPQGEHAGVLYWSPVTIGDEGAFVGFAEEQAGIAGLYAFDPETGQEMWNIPAASLILAAPTYADGVVYFGDSGGRNNGFAYAVDVESSSVKPGWPFEAEEAIWASVLVEDGRAYIASMDHFLHCVDAESGERLWDVELGGALAASPILEDGTLYVGAFDGKVYAIEASSGELVEGFDFQAGNWIWSEPLLTDGELYVTSLDGKLYALDPASGETLWSFDSGTLGDGNDTIRAAPIQAGEFIIVATEAGRVIAVQDGQQRWSWPGGTPEAAVYTTPVVRDGTVYVLLANGKLQTLNAETGTQEWAFSPPTSE